MDEEYQERIYKWLETLKPPFEQTLDPTKPTYNAFKQIVCRAIELDPMCGLEFNKEYTRLRMVDLDFSTRVAPSLIAELPAHFDQCRRNRLSTKQQTTTQKQKR